MTHTVLRPRTSTGSARMVRSQDRDMAQAGARFEAYVREAMAEQDIPSLAQLARDSGIVDSAWHGWFRGERQPRRNSLKLAGQALSRTPEQLLAVWEGERPAKRAKAPDDLAGALSDLAVELAASRAERAVLAGRLAETDAVLRDLVGRTSAIEAEHVAHPHSTGSGR